MHFVFLTSKRVFYNYKSILQAYDEGRSIVGAIWHQDVILVPFTFRNYNVVTMVSKSDQGEIMATIIKRMGFIPVRGGSSMAGSEALSEVIDYIASHEKILFGITVDGSRGPKYKVKKGVIVIAKESGAPIYPVKAWAKRKILLPSWDNTLIPLPFNEFVFFIGEPLWVDSNAGLEEIENKRQELENALAALVLRAEHHFSSRIPKEYPHESKAVHYWTDMAGVDRPNDGLPTA
ncbi:MAG: lysophospholipid acyltransferase family protein [Candidatus Abyssubacteria bacterium]